MLRIGFLTSGGDCQALNAAMRGVFKAVTRNAKEPVEFYGFEVKHQGAVYGVQKCDDRRSHEATED